jgi:hypothetical protein
MIESLSGVVTIGFILAAALSLRRGREAGDRLLVAFGVALALLAANQLLALWLGYEHENVGYVYLLRVIGYLVILATLIYQRTWQRR